MKKEDRRKINTLNLTTGALIGALYVVLTMVSQMFGLASGAVQLRLSEALTIMPVFTWAAVPGLAVGCLIANMMTGCALWDIVLGTLATFLGAAGTYIVSHDLKDGKKAGKMRIFMAALCPVLSNVLIVPFVLQFVYGAEGSWIYFVCTVGVGEIVSCCVFGLMLYRALKGVFRK